MSQPTQFLLYTAPDGAVKVDVFLKNETVWLTQKALAATISKMEIVRAERAREIARDAGWRKEWHNPVGAALGMGGHFFEFSGTNATKTPRFSL